MIELMLSMGGLPKGKNGKWRQLPYPSLKGGLFELKDPNLVPWNDYIYLMNGSLPDSSYNNEIWRYHVVNESWEKLAITVTGRTEVSVAVVNDKFYFIAGRNTTGLVNSIACYDPVANTMKLMTAVHPVSGVRLIRCIGIGGLVYMMGGRNGSGVIANCYSYDPTTDKLTTLSSVVVGYGGVIYSVDGTKVTIGLGHDAGNVATNKMSDYTIATNTWGPSTPATYARAAGSTTTRVEVIDGTAYGYGSNKLYKRLNVENPTWDAVPDTQPFPLGKVNMGSCATHGKMFILGGNSAADKDFWEYTPDV